MQPSGVGGAGGGGPAGLPAVLAVDNNTGPLPIIVEDGQCIQGQPNRALDLKTVDDGGSASSATVRITGASASPSSGDDGASIISQAGQGGEGAGGGANVVVGGDGVDEVGGSVGLFGGNATSSGAPGGFTGGGVSITPGLNELGTERARIFINSNFSVVPRTVPPTEASRGNVWVGGGDAPTFLGGYYYKRLDGTTVRLDVTWEEWQIAVDYSSNNGTYRTHSIAGNSTFRFSGRIPTLVGTISSMVLVGITSAGAAGVGKLIDYMSSYGALGALSTEHTGTHIGSAFVIPAAGTLWGLDVLPLVGLYDTPPLAGGDFWSLEVNHMGIGGTIDYLGIAWTGLYT